MRLDLYLKETRLIKRRSVAKVLCEEGYILVNDKVAKPSLNVKENDNLELHLGVRVITVIAHINLLGSREIPTAEVVSTEGKHYA